MLQERVHVWLLEGAQCSEKALEVESSCVNHSAGKELLHKRTMSKASL